MTYLSRVSLKPAAVRKFLTLASGNGPATFGHKAVWSLFDDDPDHERDFVFKVVSQNPFVAYVASKRPPQDELGLWEVDSRLFNPILRVGQKVRFELTAVPAIKILGKAYDAVKFEWHKLPEKRRQQVSQADLVQPVGFEWLKKKEEVAGFSVEEGDIAISNWIEHTFFTSERKQVTLRSIDYSGILTVTDEERFRKTLTSGIGRGRGFGFGLLLGRPA